MNNFPTYFHIANRNFIVSSGVQGNRIEYLFDTEWDKTKLVLFRRTTHSEGFAGRSLSVGENSLVDTIEGIVH